MKLYMKVTDDEYELPIAVAETKAELCRMLGYQKNGVSNAMSYARKHGGKTCFVEVEIEGEGEIDEVSNIRRNGSRSSTTRR